MSSWTEIKKSIDETASAFEEFKKANDARIIALKDGNESKAKELDDKIQKIDGVIVKFSTLKKDIEIELEAQKSRIEELEARGKQPGKGPREKRGDEYKNHFCNWVRNRGMSPDDEQKMQSLQRQMLEAKDITVGSAAGGGYAVPEEISRQIEVLEKKFSPVRNMVKVVQTGSSDYKELVSIRGVSSGWVGEAGARNPTNTPQLREVVPTMGELYAYPQVSEWSLDDIFFNVEAWLTDEVASEFALQEADAVIRGNGASKATGMLNTAPTAAPDAFPPTRAAAAYQFVENSGSPSELSADLLLDLVYKLNSAYRVNATFVMNSVTTGAVRKLKDLQGQYLWAPGLQAGQPDRLLGFGTATWEQMDDVGAGAGNFPIAFGDFRRGYVLTDRVGLRITRDNVTNVGFVRFYVRRREGGIVLNNDAIKWIRT